MRGPPPYRLRDFPSALAARGLTKSFARGLARTARRTVALSEVDLDVRPGEVIGLVGAESAGKTTLLQCLCGLLRCDSGKVELFGEPFDGTGCPPQVSYVPAVPVFYPFFTVRDVVECGFARSAFATERTANVDRALSMLDLLSVERCRISSLSRGMVKRVAIAGAVVAEPVVILVDMSASELEPPVAPDILDALQVSASSGTAVVIASRDASSLAVGATRMLLLDRGRIARTFSLESLGEPIIEAPLVPARFVAERVH